MHSEKEYKYILVYPKGPCTTYTTLVPVNKDDRIHFNDPAPASANFHYTGKILVVGHIERTVRTLDGHMDKEAPRLFLEEM